MTDISEAKPYEPIEEMCQLEVALGKIQSQEPFEPVRFHYGIGTPLPGPGGNLSTLQSGGLNRHNIYVANIRNVQLSSNALVLANVEGAWFCSGELYEYIGDQYNGAYVYFVLTPYWGRIFKFLREEIKAAHVDEEIMGKLLRGLPLAEIVLGMG